MDDLRRERCSPIPPGTPALAPAAATALAAQVSDWEIDEGKALARTIRFKNYYETIAFVNAVAWIANRQDHHPDMEVHYNHCIIRFTTHSVGGLSRNDFICAARVNALLE
jgi:4a-hydroxytetrahydrobiopterin dehydratase